ncbi:MAG: hypothetical protein WCI61_02670 [Chloroflexota bacterium]
MVRAELGGDAIILSTRKAASPGLFGQPGRQFVEVVAHLPEGGVLPRPGRRPSLDQDMAAHELARGVAEAAAMGMAIDPAVDLAPPFELPAAGRFRDAAPMTSPPAPALEPMVAADRTPMFDAPDAQSEPEMSGPFRALNEATLAASAPAAMPAATSLPPLPELAVQAMEAVRRGVVLIPVAEITLQSGSGAIRALVVNDHGLAVGDPITRQIDGTTTLILPATDGFEDISMHAAYRTGQTKPWTLRVFEAPSANALGKDFKKLLELPISSDQH